MTMIDKLVKTNAKGAKIKRDAFLYLEPGDTLKKDFAQCKTCALFTASGNCAVMNGDRVKAEGSCGAYIQYFSWRAKTVIFDYTRGELGYVERPVRCENCRYGGKTCGLYVMLNKSMPEAFDLDTEIRPDGCCNANTPK